MLSEATSLLRTCSAWLRSAASGVWKTVNPTVTLDAVRGAWYTLGVGSTTADVTTHHHERPGVHTATPGRLRFGRRLRLALPAELRNLLGWNRPLNVVWVWRQTRARLGVSAEAVGVRFVWRRPKSALRRSTGVAFLDEGRVEVFPNEVLDEAEALVVALHEHAHLLRDDGRHDRKFAAVLRGLLNVESRSSIVEAEAEARVGFQRLQKPGVRVHPRRGCRTGVSS